MSNTKTDFYAEAVDKNHEIYKGQMHEYLRSIAKAFTDAGWQVMRPEDPICDWTDETYGYSICVGEAGVELPDGGFDIKFEIAESRAYGDDDAGINFAVDCVAYGGSIVGSVQPYNYTSEVWVPMAHAVDIAERFQMVIDMEPTMWVLLCQEWVANNPSERT